MKTSTEDVIGSMLNEVQSLVCQLQKAADHYYESGLLN